MKDWLGGSYLVLKSTPRVTCDIPLMAIGYKYNYRKILWYISNRGSGSTEPDYPYVSHFRDIYSNIVFRPIVSPKFLGRYFNVCNEIDNHNIIRKSDPAPGKYWVTQSGYFRLATTVALGMGITYGKLLFCHGISEGSVVKNFSMRYYNSVKAYDWLNYTFPDDCGIPYFNIPPITIDSKPCPDKISFYTPDLLSYTIYVASEKYVITFTTHYY